LLSKIIDNKEELY